MRTLERLRRAEFACADSGARPKGHPGSGRSACATRSEQTELHVLPSKGMMSGMLSDIRYAIRVLLKNPGFGLDPLVALGYE